MTFLHFRFKDRLGLLADDSLAPAEAAAVPAHLGSCVSCQAEFEGLTRLTAALREEAAFDRPLPISSDALRTRVFARIHAEAHPLPASRSWGFVSGLAAAGLVGLGVLTGVFMARDGATRVPAVVADAAPQEDRADIAVTANNTAFYERLEKTQLRADAVRYLAEAQDILVQMRAAGDCPDSPQDSVDVAHESKNSRTILRRRAALVSGSGETLVAAGGVMEEVEGLLQQVAELPRCTRRAEVAAIARNVQHLKPGGRLISKTACVAEMNPLIRWLAIPVMQAIGKAPHVLLFDADALQAAMVRQGLVIEAVERDGIRGKDIRVFIVARKPG